MISKSQLIKKIAEKAGLLPFDSEQFFEMFLLQMKAQIKAGEVFEVKDIGFFSLKNCSIESKQVTDPGTLEQAKSFKMILFSEEASINEQNRDIHFFSIPEVISDQDDDIESHLSLSVEKPLITESEFAEEIFSAFKSNSEIKRNFTSKAEILINTMRKTGVKASEHFTLKGFSEEFVEDNFIEQKTATQKNLIWQDEATELIISNDVVDSSSSLPWDFGRKFFERKIEYPDQERIDAQDHSRKVDKQPDNQSKSPDKEKLIEHSLTEDLNKEPKADSEENADTEMTSRYERVRTFISNEMKNKGKPDADDTAAVKTEGNQLEKAEKIENEFTPVKSKSETYRLEPRKKKKPFLIKKNSISLSESKQKYDYHRRKKGILPFIIPLAILIITVGVVYIYLAKDSILSSEPENVLLKVTPPPYVNIIERDFEFAVTFPYSKSEANNEISGIDPTVFNEGVKLVEQKPKIKVKEPEKKVDTEIKTQEIVEKKVESKTETIQPITNKNISKYKDYFIVQVAAFKTYEAAETEAEGFRDQGYNAFIEIAELPGRGTWYRIKVGDFTSVKHAEDFLNKNRK